MTAPDTSPSAPLVVKHPGCPQWGMGFLIEERDNKRFYDFEDGQSHSIAREFWSRLVAVNLASQELTAIEAKIRNLKQRSAPSAKKARRRPSSSVAVTFDQQVTAFEAEFPGGFVANAYLVAERGGPGDAESAGAKKKKPKAFKASAIATARSLLSREALAPLVEGKRTDEFMERVRSVHKVAGDLLHPLGDLIPFSKMPAERHESFAAATFALLHGEGSYAERFDALVEVLAQDKIATWPLATILPALVAPEEHIFVKPSFFEKQAKVFTFDLRYERVPTGAGYGRMLELARKVEARLRDRGQAPRDLMDIYSFITRSFGVLKNTGSGPLGYDD